jgi:hypothetical protein
METAPMPADAVAFRRPPQVGQEKSERRARKPLHEQYRPWKPPEPPMHLKVPNVARRPSVSAFATPLNDGRIRQVLRDALSKQPSNFDFALFAKGVRKSACCYLEAIAEPTARQLRDELVTLYCAIERALKTSADHHYDEVASRLQALSESAWEILDCGWTPAPRPDAIRNTQEREKACRELFGRCAAGGCFKEGRRRANGRRSRPTFQIDFKPALRRGQARRNAAMFFIFGVRLAFINAGGTAPRTAREYESRHHAPCPGPFVRMVQLLLDMLSPKRVSAVEQINRLHHAPTGKRPKRLPRLDKIQREIVRALGETQPLTQTQISNLFNRHLPRELLKKALSGLERRRQIASTKQKTRGAPRRMWSLRVEIGRENRATTYFAAFSKHRRFSTRRNHNTFNPLAFRDLSGNYP